MKHVFGLRYLAETAKALLYYHMVLLHSLHVHVAHLVYLVYAVKPLDSRQHPNCRVSRAGMACS
jgi:hypothetical protein